MKQNTWISLFGSVLFLSLIACETIPQKKETDSKYLGISHHYQLVEKQDKVFLAVYSPVEPFNLLKEIALKQEEFSKIKELLELIKEFEGEKAKEFDEEFEYLLETIEERNKKPSQENELEVLTSIEMLIPH